MPFIDAKLSVKLDENQKNKLQAKLTDAVAAAFSKPKAYIMAGIEDEKSLYMDEKKLDKGAYISISLLGSTSKPVCQNISQKNSTLLVSNLSPKSKVNTVL